MAWYRFVTDVTDKQSISSLVEHIERTEGKLHLLVNKSVFHPVSRFSFHRQQLADCILVLDNVVQSHHSLAVLPLLKTRTRLHWVEPSLIVRISMAGPSYTLSMYPQSSSYR